MKISNKVCSKLLVLFVMFLGFSHAASAGDSYVYSESDKAKIMSHIELATKNVGLSIANGEIRKLTNNLIADMTMLTLAYGDEKVVKSFIQFGFGNRSNFIRARDVFKANNKLLFSRARNKIGTVFSKTDYAFFVTDIIIEFIKIDTLGNDKAKGLLLALLYSDVKAYIKLQTGDPFGASLDWSEANFKAIKGSTVGIYKLIQENSELIDQQRRANANSSARNKLLEYYKDVGKAATAKLKKQNLDFFYNECVRNSPSVGFSTEDRQYIKNMCYRYKLDIIKFDFNKKKYLFKRMRKKEGLYSKNEFNQYLTDFFPEGDYSIYRNTYDSLNFDPDVELSIDSYSYKHIKKAISYGFEGNDFIAYQSSSAFYQAEVNIRRDQAITLMLMAKYLPQKLSDSDYHNKFDADYKSIVGNNDAYAGQLLTRQQVATYLNTEFELDYSFSEKKKNVLKRKAQFISSKTGWTYDALVLKRLKIVNGQNINMIPQFRSGDFITMYEFVAMLFRSLDFRTCGYVDCELYDVLNLRLNSNN